MRVPIRNRPRVAFVLVALTMVVLAAACAGSNEDQIASEGGGDGLDATTDAGSGTSAPIDDTPGAPGDLEVIPDSDAGVTEDTIHIGIHAPETLSGIDIGSILGLRPLTEAYWDTVNQNGGINGRMVDVTLVNDQYNATGAVDACRQLVDDDLLFVSGTSGADQVVACAQVVTGAGIPYLSLGVTAAGLTDTPGYRAITLPYDAQAPIAARYLVDELGAEPATTAMIRFGGANSDGAHEAFVEAIEGYGGSLAVDDAVDKDGNPNELTAECLKLEENGVEFVFVVAAPSVTRVLVDACAAQGVEPTYLMAANTAGCSTRPPLYGPAFDGCLQMSGSRLPDASDSPLVEEAHAEWEARNPGVDFPENGEGFWGLFDIYREAMTQAGDDLTTHTFLQAVDALEYDNGLSNPVRFAPGSRVGGTGVVIWQAEAATEGFTEVVSEYLEP